MKKQISDVNNTLNEIKSKTSSSSEASEVVSINILALIVF